MSPPASAPPPLPLPLPLPTETVCNPIELSRKSIKDVEQCYTVTRTVCTESTEVIDNEVCTHSYQPKTEATTAMTALP
jgi:hypothetical protein